MKRAIWIGLSVFLGCEVSPPVTPAPPKAAQARKPEAPPPAEGPSPEEAEALRAALLGAPKLEEVAPTPPAPAKLRPRRRPVDETAELEPEPAAPASLSDDEFAATVGAWKGMRRCLDTDVSRVDNRAGALRMAVTIRGDGSVSDVKVLNASEGAAQTISACVEKGTRRLRFASFADASVEITKEAKFVF